MKKGSMHSLESIKKMSQSHKGAVVSPEHRKKLSEAFKGKKNHFYGKHHNEKTKIAISEAKKGKKASTETKIRMSKSHKGHEVSLATRQKISKGNKGEKHYNFGKHLPKETKRKLSESQKGEKCHMFGTHLSEETKRKLSKARKGVPLSPEHIIKISGEKHHCWQGGISFLPYGIAFNKKLKELIRARDGYRCQECFTHQSELFSKTGKPKKLACHHINYTKTDNRPSNLISLCPKCHAKTGFKRKDWIKHFQKKEVKK